MIDIKELRRLAEAPVLHVVEWVNRDWAQEHFGSDCEAEFVSTFTPSTILSLLDNIDVLTGALQTAKHALFRDGATQELEEVFAALESVGIKP